MASHFGLLGFPGTAAGDGAGRGTDGLSESASPLQADSVAEKLDGCLALSV